jgi:cell wall-associated NlpC family hydrolase
MSDSTPVPLGDLQPGDLLFYGPGGDEHVAMYIGNGQMIEAPYTGANVWITGVRLGGDFAGAGRP